MDSKHNPLTLAHVPDSRILEEAAARLQAQHTRETGGNLQFGSFRFIFHDGRFQGVEDWPRKKSYMSPERFAGPRKQKEARDGSGD